MERKHDGFLLFRVGRRKAKSLKHGAHGAHGEKLKKRTSFSSVCSVCSVFQSFLRPTRNVRKPYSQCALRSSQYSTPQMPSVTVIIAG
ncbi:hypothetical protein FHW12_002435 [Dokdonella fugitiva]|uniref:Uncharacterized protein n=1 Tax=Dokdonella fugitiva TaxID=328517 RepID=A0A839F7S3_9GAMM|nr:hypothetical protein [Dokdonella fugitiva]